MDVESVRRADRLAGFEMRGDALGVDARLHFIGQRHDDQVGRLDRHLRRCMGVEAMLNGQLAVGAVLAVGDDDLDAAVAEVQAVGVALRAEAEDRDGFADKPSSGASFS